MLRKNLSNYLALTFLLVLVGGLPANTFGFVPRWDRKKPVFRKKLKRTSLRPNLYQPVIQPTASPAAASPAPPAVQPNYNEMRELLVTGGTLRFPIKEMTAPTMTLGLAPRGVIVIEYPADDPIYQVHPGDENFVTVSCTTSGSVAGKSSDANIAVECQNSPYDAMILRPGSEFFKEGTDSSTLITVIRNSGMVFTFLIVPVKTPAKNANHVLLQYNTEQMTDNRKKAGLSFNLLKNQGRNNSVKTAAPQIMPESKTVPEKLTAVMPPVDELERRTIDLLTARVSANQDKLNFTKTVYGLSAAVLPSGARVQDKAIDVVAVKNTLQVPVKLVDNQPVLYIETINNDKQSVEAKPLPILNMATTLEADNILQPGRIYYFALAYDTPLLGSRQQLKVSFAQTNATDAPVAINLLGIAR